MSSPESTSVEIEMDSTTILNLMQREVELESESESMTDQENLNETQTGEELDESLYIEEESQKDEAGTENPEEAFPEEVVAAEEVLLYPDLITPLLKLFIFNMMLPTVDTFFDSVLIKKLFEDGYWGSG